jgi:hypothetical protein
MMIFGWIVILCVHLYFYYWINMYYRILFFLHYHINNIFLISTSIFARSQFSFKLENYSLK